MSTPERSASAPRRFTGCPCGCANRDECILADDRTTRDHCGACQQQLTITERDYAGAHGMRCSPGDCLVDQLRGGRR